MLYPSKFKNVDLNLSPPPEDRIEESSWVDELQLQDFENKLLHLENFTSVRTCLPPAFVQHIFTRRLKSLRLTKLLNKFQNVFEPGDPRRRFERMLERFSDHLGITNSKAMEAFKNLEVLEIDSSILHDIPYFRWFFEQCENLKNFVIEVVLADFAMNEVDRIPAGVSELSTLKQATLIDVRFRRPRGDIIIMKLTELLEKMQACDDPEKRFVFTEVCGQRRV